LVVLSVLPFAALSASAAWPAEMDAPTTHAVALASAPMPPEFVTSSSPAPDEMPRLVAVASALTVAFRLPFAAALTATASLSLVAAVVLVMLPLFTTVSLPLSSVSDHCAVTCKPSSGSPAVTSESLVVLAPSVSMPTDSALALALASSLPCTLRSASLPSEALTSTAITPLVAVASATIVPLFVTSSLPDPARMPPDFDSATDSALVETELANEAWMPAAAPPVIAEALLERSEEVVMTSSPSPPSMPMASAVAFTETSAFWLPVGRNVSSTGSTSP
jgi:hypothetical protein